MNEGDVIRQNNLLQYIGLPHRLSHHKLKPRKILEHIQYDKKIINGKINFVLLNSIGDGFVYDEIGLEEIKNVLEQ